jgi:Protein of unknown function (DUF2970)
MSGEPGHDLREAAARKGSFAQTLKAVAWSFFGVRKSADYEQDLAKVNPVHVIVAGVLGGVVFVLALVLVVQWVVSNASGTGF